MLSLFLLFLLFAVSSTNSASAWIQLPIASVKKRCCSSSSLTRLFAKRKKPNTNVNPNNSKPSNISNSDKYTDDTIDDGQVGSGRNWIERSFPVNTQQSAATTTGEIIMDGVEDYNLGICGDSYQTGPLSLHMYNAICDRSSIPPTERDLEVQRAFKLYAMDFTAKEAVRAALEQNGLELVLTNDEQDQGMWGDVDSIRLLDTANSRMYDSWQEAVQDWTPGQGFDFVARQVPAKLIPLSLTELLSALDPNGKLLQQQQQANGQEEEEEEQENIFDPAMRSLQDLANENVRRTEASPRGPARHPSSSQSDNDDNVESLHPLLLQRGYRPIQACKLLRLLDNDDDDDDDDDDDIDDNSQQHDATTMHVMDALVSHGCLLVDLMDEDEDGNDSATTSSSTTTTTTTTSRVQTMASMWEVVETFYKNIQQQEQHSLLPPLSSIPETGSRHAKIGFASYDDGNLQFLETRRKRINNIPAGGEQQSLLLPENSGLSPDQCQALQNSFDLIARFGKAIVRTAVAASTIEARMALGNNNDNNASAAAAARRAARLLANELVDDGMPLLVDDKDCDAMTRKQQETEATTSTVSMSPHRLCRYSNNKKTTTSNDSATNTTTTTSTTTTTNLREVFGAHTDSTFLTIVPVAAVPGLEVYDEAIEQWYSPERAARQYWQREQQQQSKKKREMEEELLLPWHARYAVVMPGEFLQITTRGEISAAVHRVVAAASKVDNDNDDEQHQQQQDCSRLSAPVLLRGRPGMTLRAERYLLSSGDDPPLIRECEGMTMEDIHDAMQPTSFQ